MLGDSFTEGFGVEDGARLSDLLEAETGVEHLNFGTSGFFGPTQYFLLYRSLAKQFRHDKVLVGFLPANDFDEDDLDFGKRFFGQRYRPYFVGSDPDYHLEYFRDSLAASTFRAPPDTFRNRMRRFLKETSHAYDFYAYFRVAKDFEAEGEEKKKTTESRYYSFTDAEIRRLHHVLELLVKEAAPRPVTVFVIPTTRDLDWYAARGDPPLSRRLAEMAAELGFEVVDLLPAFAATPGASAAYFHSCDGHWSSAGHAAAARVLVSHTLDSVP